MCNTVEISDEHLEIQLLLEAIYRKYGYDFRNYAFAHTKRRLENRRAYEGLRSFSEMSHSFWRSRFEMGKTEIMVSCLQQEGTVTTGFGGRNKVVS